MVLGRTACSFFKLQRQVYPASFLSGNAQKSLTPNICLSHVHFPRPIRCWRSPHPRLLCMLSTSPLLSTSLRQPRRSHGLSQSTVIGGNRRYYQSLLHVSDTRNHMQERYCRLPQQHIKHIRQPRQFLSPNVLNHALELRPCGLRQKHVSSMSNIKETRRPWLPENDIALLELRRQGWSWKAIGQFFERSPQATQRRYNSLLWLDAHGSRHKGPASPEALETQMKVLKIWINEQGMSWEQAAALLETKVPVLQHRLQIWEESEEKQKALLQTLKEDHRVGMAKVADIQADRQPTRVRFSRAGEDKLLQAIEKYGAENWEKIARQVFDNRYTPYQLRRKYIQIKQWTKAREDHLMACVSQVAKYPDGVFNDSVWQTTAEKMKAKEGVQYTPAECHDKWIDVLRRRGIDPAKWSPPWSASEMNSFWSLWKTYGQDWEAIASRLERRTVQDCQLQFPYLLKDGSERGPKDPEELEVLRLYFSASTPKRIRWSTDMQDQLEEAVQAWREIHPGQRINWKWVAKRLNLPGVTDLKCFQRWSNSHQKRAHMRSDSSEHPRKETEEEDNPRCIKSVADVNEIDDNHQLTQGQGAKKKWTEAESQQLTALLSKYGRSAIAWHFIAQRLGTTLERCKTRWRRMESNKSKEIL